MQDDFEKWYGLMSKVHRATNDNSTNDQPIEVDNPTCMMPVLELCSSSKTSVEPCSSSKTCDNSNCEERHYFQTEPEEACSHKGNNLELRGTCSLQDISPWI